MPKKKERLGNMEITEILLGMNTKFSDEDKELAKPTIEQMVKLADRIRTHGVLAIKDMEREPSVFLKTAIGLICDGLAPDTIKLILNNLVLADSHTGTILLEKLLIAEGISSILSGDNPRVTECRMLSLLGENYIINSYIFERK